MIYIGKSFIGTLNHGARPEIFEKARELRKTQTDAERILWEVLRSRRYKGLKFRRQHPCSKFILDFYCHEQKLAIEVDGGIHLNEEVRERDSNRTACLEDLGIRILRFTNEQVIFNMDFVLRQIERSLL